MWWHAWILLQTTTEMMMEKKPNGRRSRVFIDHAYNPLDKDLFVFQLDRHARVEQGSSADVAQF